MRRKLWDPYLSVPQLLLNEILMAGFGLVTFGGLSSIAEGKLLGLSGISVMKDPEGKVAADPLFKAGRNFCGKIWLLKS